MQIFNIIKPHIFMSRDKQRFKILSYNPDNMTIYYLYFEKSSIHLPISSHSFLF